MGSRLAPHFCFETRFLRNCRGFWRLCDGDGGDCLSDAYAYGGRAMWPASKENEDHRCWLAEQLRTEWSGSAQQKAPAPKLTVKCPRSVSLKNSHGICFHGCVLNHTSGNTNSISAICRCRRRRMR